MKKLIGVNKLVRFALLLVIVCVLVYNQVSVADIPEIVLDASDAINITGEIEIVEAEGASIGELLEINGQESGNTPVAEPSDYAEMEFLADADKTYYIWTRGKALTDDLVSDAVWIQFDDKIGTAELGETYNHIKGFGNWLDIFPVDTYAWSSGLPQEPPQTITFDEAGEHKLRIQPRHVTHYLDQIWLSITQEVIPDFAEPVEKPAGQNQAVKYSGKLTTIWGEIKAIQND